MHIPVENLDVEALKAGIGKENIIESDNNSVTINIEAFNFETDNQGYITSDLTLTYKTIVTQEQKDELMEDPNDSTISNKFSVTVKDLPAVESAPTGPVYKGEGVDDLVTKSVHAVDGKLIWWDIEVDIPASKSMSNIVLNDTLNDYWQHAVHYLAGDELSKYFEYYIVEKNGTEKQISKEEIQQYISSGSLEIGKTSGWGDTNGKYVSFKCTFKNDFLNQYRGKTILIRYATRMLGNTYDSYFNTVTPSYTINNSYVDGKPVTVEQKPEITSQKIRFSPSGAKENTSLYPLY